MDSILLHTLLFLLGLAAFTLSTVSGGGGALVLVPILHRVLGVEIMAPVLNLGTFIGRPARLLLFWRHIHWRLVRYYAPAAIAGAWLGAWIFQRTDAQWLRILIALFLISTAWQFSFGKKKQSFRVAAWQFIPLGMMVAVLGTIIGGLGPVLNPFYLNLGLDKEELIATKTANSFFLGMSQLGSYAFFGLLGGALWGYGLALGLGATVGDILGKRFLKEMKSETFRPWVVALMVLSGLLMLGEGLLGE